jgi:ligand-binding sensor domain-containing protein
MFARRAIFKQPCSVSLIAWALRFSWAIACTACPFPAFSEAVPIWTPFTPENSDLPHTDILALTLGEDGELWIGTHGGGLARLDKDGHWRTYTANARGGLPANLVLALARGADGALWIGTEHGLARRDKDGSWRTYTTASTNGGLPHDRVIALAPDADGTLWIGTYGGLARLDRCSSLYLI